jgi:hypothetical protein
VDRREEIRVRLREIDALTEDEATEYHLREQRDLIAEYDRLDRDEQIDRVRSAAQDPANREGAAEEQPRGTAPAPFRPAGNGGGIWRARSAWQGLDEGTWGPPVDA